MKCTTPRSSPLGIQSLTERVLEVFRGHKCYFMGVSNHSGSIKMEKQGVLEVKTIRHVNLAYGPLDVAYIN